MMISRAGSFHSFLVVTVYATNAKTPITEITICAVIPVILSKNSLQSNHVLNEIDLAFQEIGRAIHFCPLKIDEEELGPAFRYYLSRQHWMDAHVPPLEKRLDEFVKSILQELMR